MRQRACACELHEAGVYVVSLVSSPGAGKTAFLERGCSLPSAIGSGSPLSSATWPPTTTLAAWPVSRCPVKQITTGTVCHLEAEMIVSAVEGWRLDELDFLFIENVGNLVCPSTFDLGEDVRLVLFSVTEGEDKPLKYPTIFNTADVAILTKIDLSEGGGVRCRRRTSQHPGRATRHANL